MWFIGEGGGRWVCNIYRGGVCVLWEGRGLSGKVRLEEESAVRKGSW